MRLPSPPPGYSRQTEAARNRMLEDADAHNFKRGRDIEVGRGRVILTAPDGTRWALKVDGAGNLTTEAVS